MLRKFHPFLQTSTSQGIRESALFYTAQCSSEKISPASSKGLRIGCDLLGSLCESSGATTRTYVHARMYWPHSLSMQFHGVLFSCFHEPCFFPGRFSHMWRKSEELEMANTEKVTFRSKLGSRLPITIITPDVILYHGPLLGTVGLQSCKMCWQSCQPDILDLPQLLK